MESTSPPDEARAPDGGRLDSWKEIATFLGRGVTTVQRWEEEEGLPVHRHAHAKRGTVYAFKSELATWRDSRAAQPPAAPADVDPVADRPEPPAVFDDGSHAAVLVGTSSSEVRRPRRGWLLALVPVFAAVALAMTLGVPLPSSDAAGASVPQPLAFDPATEIYPSLSPDGRLVAYRWSRPDTPGIYIRPTAGGDPWALPLEGNLSPTRKDSFPKWSPDGKWIAFLRELSSSVWDVHVVPARGGTSRRVTQMTSGSVSWLPDNQTLAVVDRPSSGEPYSVFLVSVATGQRHTRVTFPPYGTFGDWHCAVSPDGTRIAVARFRSNYDADLYVTTVSEGEAGLRRLTNDAAGLDQLTWTPDGESIVFTSHRSGRASLWQVSADSSATGAPRLVAGAEGGAKHPTIARTSDGGSGKLVYTYSRGLVAVWRWDLGADPRPEPQAILTSGSGADDHASWSPDGSQVAFISNRAGNFDVWIAESDGTNPRQLTFRGGALTLQPRWSPDGRWILFTSMTAGQHDLFKVRVDGADASRLTSGLSEERNGSWSRDGRWIYFRSNRGGLVRVWKTEADRRREPVPATTAESSEAIESLDGHTLYFTKPFEAGLWQKPLPDGPETLLVPDWHVREGFWDVTRDGIIMMDRQVGGSEGRQPLTLFSFATSEFVHLGMLPVQISDSRDGLSARPDGSVLWSQSVPLFSDLMMLDWDPPRP